MPAKRESALPTLKLIVPKNTLQQMQRAIKTGDRELKHNPGGTKPYFKAFYADEDEDVQSAKICLRGYVTNNFRPQKPSLRVKIRKAFGFPRRNDPLMIAAGLAMRDPGFGLITGDGVLDDEALQDVLEAALGSELARLAHNHTHFGMCV